MVREPREGAPASAALAVVAGPASAPAGEDRLVDAPDPNGLPGVTTTAGAGSATTTTTGAEAAEVATSTSAVASVPTVSVDENTATGIVPPDDPTCR